MGMYQTAGGSATPRTVVSAPSVTTELDNLRFDAVVEFATLAESYWKSAAEAAFRGDRRPERFSRLRLASFRCPLAFRRAVRPL